MENLLGNLVSAAIVAAGGGVALLAYKHPKGYKKLTALLTRLLSLGGIFLCGWMLALEMAKAALDSRLAPADAAAARDVVASCAPDLWVVLTVFALSLYILILDFLPLFGTDQGNGKGADSKVP